MIVKLIHEDSSDSDNYYKDAYIEVTEALKDLKALHMPLQSNGYVKGPQFVDTYVTVRGDLIR